MHFCFSLYIPFFFIHWNKVALTQLNVKPMLLTTKAFLPTNSRPSCRGLFLKINFPQSTKLKKKKKKNQQFLWVFNIPCGRDHIRHLERLLPLGMGCRKQSALSSQFLVGVSAISLQLHWTIPVLEAAIWSLRDIHTDTQNHGSSLYNR